MTKWLLDCLDVNIANGFFDSFVLDRQMVGRLFRIRCSIIYYSYLFSVSFCIWRIGCLGVWLLSYLYAPELIGIGNVYFFVIEHDMFPFL